MLRPCLTRPTKKNASICKTLIPSCVTHVQRTAKEPKSSTLPENRLSALQIHSLTSTEMNFIADVNVPYFMPWRRRDETPIPFTLASSGVKVNSGCRLQRTPGNATATVEKSNVQLAIQAKPSISLPPPSPLPNIQALMPEVIRPIPIRMF